MLSEFCFCSACAHGLDPVVNEPLAIEGTKLLEIALKVGLSRLAFVTDCHSHVLVVVARGTRLEQVSASLVDRSDKETHTEGTLVWMASLSLGLLANDRDETLCGLLRPIDIRVVEAGVAHELRQEASISCQA